MMFRRSNTYKYIYGREETNFTPKEVVERAIEDASSDYQGVLEGLRAQHRELVNFFMEVFELLPEDTQRAVIRRCTYGWNEVDT